MYKHCNNKMLKLIKNVNQYLITQKKKALFQKEQQKKMYIKLSKNGERLSDLDIKKKD